MRASALAATTDAALSSPAAVPADAAVAAATPPGEPTGETVVGNVAAAFGDVSRVCAACTSAIDDASRYSALRPSLTTPSASATRQLALRVAQQCAAAALALVDCRADAWPAAPRAALADAALEAGEWARALDDRCETARLAGTLPGDSTTLDTRALVLELDAPAPRSLALARARARLGELARADWRRSAERAREEGSSPAAAAAARVGRDVERRSRAHHFGRRRRRLYEQHGPSLRLRQV